MAEAVVGGAAAGLVGGLFGGGGGGGSPSLSPEERLLLSEQTALLRESSRLQRQQLSELNLLSPELFREVGLREIRDRKGAITGIERLPFSELSPERQRQLGIQQGFEERALAALRGDLPVDPALLRQLDEERGRLERTLQVNLGPGFATSTPGIEALGAFERRRSEILDAARRADLTTAEAGALGRESAILQRPFASIGAMTLPTQRFQPQGFTNIASGFSGPLSTLATSRALATQAGLASQSMQAQGATGFGQLAGTVLTAPVFGAGQPSLLGRMFSPSSAATNNLSFFNNSANFRDVEF